MYRFLLHSFTKLVAGEFLVSRRRYKEAANLYERAAELRPDDHELAVAAATSMRKAARYADAEKWYRKAVSIKPTVSTILVTVLELAFLDYV